MSLLLREFEAAPELFITELDTKLAKIIDGALALAGHYPSILEAIQADQDRHARVQKAQRLRDRRWLANRTEQIPGFEDDLKDEWEIDEETLTLGGGRPRMPAEVCYVFMDIRGYFGSVTDSQADERIRESCTIRRYLARRGLGMPSERTILDNVNCISNGTRELILAAQLDGALVEGLDDLRMAIIDSTAVHANSAWPTDSEILHKLVRSTFRLGKDLADFGVPEFREWRFPYWIKKLNGLAFEISLVGGKKGAGRKRRKLYQDVYQTAEKAVGKLELECEHVADGVKTADLMPSLRDRLDYVWSCIQEGIGSIHRVVAYSKKRIFEQEKVEASEKILSLSDPSAAMIVKGQREPVLGYKPQIVRSEQGLITGLLTPFGNAADSACLLPAVETHRKHSGVTPERISCDDGYAYGAAREELLKRKEVKQVSFSGSKGKAIIPDEEWRSEDYQFLRNKRSSVEGCIFVLKNMFDFDQVRRRGLDSVRAELLEKVIAYNFWRIGFLRKRKTSNREAA